MVGGTALEPSRPNPCDFLSDKQWALIIELAQDVPIFKGIDTDMEANLGAWRAILMNPEPYACDWTEWAQALNSF